MIRFLLNSETHATHAPPGSVALDYLRAHAKLKGTKEGCREGDCGACAVLLGMPEGPRIRYRPVASCLLPLAEAHGRHVVTIEGLNQATPTPIQQALIDEGATQCGFCTPGIVIGLTGFLLNSRSLSVEDAKASIEGNLCRCTGYVSILRAIDRLIEQTAPYLSGTDRIKALVALAGIPRSFLDAPEHLAHFEDGTTSGGANGQAVVLGGGTDLFVQRADELLADRFRPLSREPALNAIRLSSDGLMIGGAVTTEALIESAEVQTFRPEMPALLRLVSSQLVRNRATVAGNLVNASPIGDLSIMLLALNAELHLDHHGAKRRLPLNAFFKAYKAFDLQPGEIIEHIRLPSAVDEARFHFEKVSRRTYLDIACVNTAALVRLEDDVIRDVMLAAGGVAPIPLRLKATEEMLKGQPLTCDTLSRAATSAEEEIAPISDVRGSARYKSRLLRRLLFAHFITLFPEHQLEGVLL